MSNLAQSITFDPPRTEMIDGVIYAMARPSVSHFYVKRKIFEIFRNYLKGKKCDVFDDSVNIFFSKDDRLVPDISVVCNKDFIKSDGVHGTPDLIAEILSPSTSKRDRTIKKALYEKHGVKEYWVVDVGNVSIEVYHLADGKYQLYDIFSLLTELEKQSILPQDLEKIHAQFKTSIFDDLIIDLKEVFEDVYERE